MLEHDEARTISFIREHAEKSKNHPDAGVRLLANDVLVLDDLCVRLFRAMEHKDAAPSAAFAFREIYL